MDQLNNCYSFQVIFNFVIVPIRIFRIYFNLTRSSIIKLFLALDQIGPCHLYRELSSVKLLYIEIFSSTLDDDLVLVYICHNPLYAVQRLSLHSSTGQFFSSEIFIAHWLANILSKYCDGGYLLVAFAIKRGEDYIFFLHFSQILYTIFNFNEFELGKMYYMYWIWHHQPMRWSECSTMGTIHIVWMIWSIFSINFLTFFHLLSAFAWMDGE